MAQTSSIKYDAEGPKRENVDILAVASTVVYGGALAAIGSPNHATAANKGAAYQYDAAAGSFAAGWSQGRYDYNTSDTDIRYESAGLNKVALETDRQKRLLPVTGIAGDKTDRLKLVYASDSETFTLTRPTIGQPIGIIRDFYSSSYAWVSCFSLEDMAIAMLSGGGQQTLPIGVISGDSGASDSDDLFKYKLQFPGKVIDVYGVVTELLTGTSPDLDLNFAIGDGATQTDLTGGVIEWLDTDILGARKDGTAITAANTFVEGQVLTVDIVVNTEGTGGLMTLYAVVEHSLA